MEPLTIDDLACLIEQKPTIQTLVKIDRCKIDEFQDLMGDCIYGKFLRQVVGLKRVTSVGMELKATQEWARQTISTIAASEVIIGHRIHEHDTNSCSVRRVVMTRARTRMRPAKPALPSTGVTSSPFEESTG